MPISSNTLFHFTSSIVNLLSILEYDFRPHFSLEDLNAIMPGHPELEFGIPMVSFCDIPLSQTIKHLNVYGSYGIGLRKEWGVSNGICPVLYTYPRSLLAQKLCELVQKITQLPDTTGTSNQLLDDFHDITCYVKPYEGNVILSDGEEKSIRFYDEREWRYVPKLSEESFRYGLAKVAFEDPEKIKDANKHLWSQDTIQFKPNDVKYLIVKLDKEILDLIKKVEELKGKRYSFDDIKLLSSRVISAEQIRSDF